MHSLSSSETHFIKEKLGEKVHYSLCVKGGRQSWWNDYQSDYVVQVKAVTNWERRWKDEENSSIGNAYSQIMWICRWMENSLHVADESTRWFKVSYLEKDLLDSAQFIHKFVLMFGQEWRRHSNASYNFNNEQLDRFSIFHPSWESGGHNFNKHLRLSHMLRLNMHQLSMAPM